MSVSVRLHPAFAQPGRDAAGGVHPADQEHHAHAARLRRGLLLLERPGLSATAVLGMVLLLFSLSACGGPPVGSMAQTKQSHPQTHPLMGRIWDTGARRFIQRSELAARLVRSRHVLLGEKHDNPRHHQLQAWALAALVKAGRRPLVAWEMVTPAEAWALSQHLRDRPRDAAGLGSALGWKRRGWGPWSLYLPIARVALEAGLPMVDAGVERRAVMAAIHGRGADPDRTPALPAAARAALTRQIRRAHCGHAQGRMLRAMVTAQRLRDLRMARQLTTRATTGGAVLIAGNGHVRADFGVPFYLKAVDPAVQLVVLSPQEVRPGVTRPQDYFAGPPPFDYLWFTTRVDTLDPCEKFRKQLQRMKRHRRSRPKSAR